MVLDAMNKSIQIRRDQINLRIRIVYPLKKPRGVENDIIIFILRDAIDGLSQFPPNELKPVAGIQRFQLFPNVTPTIHPILLCD